MLNLGAVRIAVLGLGPVGLSNTIAVGQWLTLGFDINRFWIDAPQRVADRAFVGMADLSLKGRMCSSMLRMGSRSA